MNNMTETEKQQWLKDNVEITFLTPEEIDTIIDNSNTITIDMTTDEWISWSNEVLKNNIE